MKYILYDNINSFFLVSISGEKVKMLVLGEIFSFCHMSLEHHKYDE